MRVLTNKDTVATEALIGRLPIDARHSTKPRKYLGALCGAIERSSTDFLRMVIWANRPKINHIGLHV
jgi:hypothetical protein